MTLTQATVRELLDYDPETGALTWKRRDRRWFTSDRIWNSWNAKHAGKLAFTSLDTHGYAFSTICRAHCLAHRVVWLWVTGCWPSQIDHKNRVRTDNRWHNLREVTNRENSQNRSLRRDNKSGHAGVCRANGGEGYVVEISVNGRRRYLGRHPTIEAAVAVRKAAEFKYGYGDFV